MAGLLVLALVALVIGLAMRFDPLVYIFYVLVGLYVTNRFWLRRSLGALRGRRVLGTGRTSGLADASDTSAFLGDRVEATLEIRNTSLLPIAWVTLDEYLPPALRPIDAARWVLTLAPKERRVLRYHLFCGHRGYFPIGPLRVSGGTPWEAERQEQPLLPTVFFTVYPHIVPLADLGLPSRLPLGARRSANPLLPDPSRLVGVRDYQPGDRQRDIHWRASARLGALQVKKFEPSQPLEVVIFLDFDAEAYDFRTRERASELAIVVAASIAADVVDQRQAVGLASNGRDPLAERRAADPTAPTAALLTTSALATPPMAPEPEPATPAVALPATDRLTAGAVAGLAPPARRPIFSTDPFAPPALPEQTYDEDASAFIDGPVTDRPPAAPIAVPAHPGRSHLGVILTVLARIALRESPRDRPGADTTDQPPLPFARLVRRRAAGLPWGTTIVLITAAPTPELLPTLLQLRQNGFSPVALFVQPPRLATDLDAATIRAANLPAYEVYDEGLLAHLQMAARRNA
jgi:uncharacterized protein (DUF58 family)